MSTIKQLVVSNFSKILFDAFYPPHSELKKTVSAPFTRLQFKILFIRTSKCRYSAWLYVAQDKVLSELGQRLDDDTSPFPSNRLRAQLKLGTHL